MRLSAWIGMFSMSGLLVLAACTTTDEGEDGADAGATGGTAGSGGTKADAGTCDLACISTNCGTEQTACQNSATCAAILACQDSCQNKACLYNCVSDNTDGGTAPQELTDFEKCTTEKCSC